MHLDWRSVVGLGPTPDPHDPVERLLHRAVIEKTLEFRQRELDHIAVQTARALGA